MEEVEEEETVENDESEQEGAAVVAGHRDPLEQFGPVFWGLVHSLLHSFSYDDHVLVWPPGPCPMVTHSSQPPSGPGEGPAPLQEREDLAEGGEASQGEHQAEGAPTLGASRGLHPRSQRNLQWRLSSGRVAPWLLPLSPGRLGPVVLAGPRWANGGQALRPLRTLWGHRAQRQAALSTGL